MYPIQLEIHMRYVGTNCTQWKFAQIICAVTQGAVIRTKEVYVYPCYKVKIG